MNHNGKVVYAIPEVWDIKPQVSTLEIIPYTEIIPICLKDLLKSNRRRTANSWFHICNGRFATRINSELLEKVLADIKANVVAVNASPQLQAGQEKVLTNSQGELVGFRRFYNDLVQPAQISKDWPQHLFIKTDILNRLLVDDALPLSFPKFIDNCFSNSLTVCSLNIGGDVLDLATSEGLLGLLATNCNFSVWNHHNANNKYQHEALDRDGVKTSSGVRLFGKVLFGKNVSIGSNTIIVGPTVISNGVKIAKGAVIKNSIVGPDISVSQNSIVQNRVLINGRQFQKHIKLSKSSCMSIITNGRTYRDYCADNFRMWPRISYARCFKRIADIIAAVVVLTLFAPIFPIIALVIKLTSRGGVFFKDPRQGLHGKVFNCLKFRTMLVGADRIQDKLRVSNQADGPQFKMADDPRLSVVGGFLRETYIDEIPQFFNVLLGQMSVVGPRPSPELENTLCPWWRDARLSVRPGITGLWQVYRTRQPMRDFQEWIYYDTKYVRNLSLRMDLWICWQTAMKLIKNFVRQF